MAYQTEERKKPGPKPKRPPRVPMVQGLSLVYHNQDPNYYYKWVSDRDSRVQQHLDAWYDFVLTNGNREKREGGKYTQYLMRIERKYHEEDQKLKEEKLKDTIIEQQKLDKDEYRPDGRDHVLQKDEYDPLG